MPLDPQAQHILEEAAALGLPSYQDLSPAAARKQMRDQSPPADPFLSVDRVENRTIPGPESDLRIRLYYPQGESSFPVLAPCVRIVVTSNGTGHRWGKWKEPVGRLEFAPSVAVENFLRNSFWGRRRLTCNIPICSNKP